ncbi:MAG: alpha/beta hydrolase [Chloroflexi bacterium]|nr:alpha/beta hydrolase [Chloroflexota bacterium]MBU1747526.1 alpha/beta hydrolase [Chloroflexota bacterium]MBU1879307.1 alpha/beta hydrolase [Chloroflexota bacterium]
MDKQIPNVLPGITSQMVDTPRLQMHVLSCGPVDGEPVVFIHGNFSSATYYEETMLAMPPRYRCLAPDLRGYGLTEDKLIDAARGARDWSDDLDALFTTLGLGKVHLLGWSLGAGPVLQYLIDHPAKVASITLLDPISPYGFGGTRELDGQSCFPDYAGAGGGVVNPEFVGRIAASDRTDEDPNSPRNIINAFYYKPPFRAAREEDFLSASLLERTGEQKYPGDMVPSANWPNVAPGDFGPINATSPKHFDVSGIVDAMPKPPILWVRGSDDQVVGDASMFDIGTLGKLGFVPGWPGDEVYPPQPMVSQTRAVLEQYAAGGGRYQEHVIQDAAHGPHIEKPSEFNAVLHQFLAQAGAD